MGIAVFSQNFSRAPILSVLSVPLQTLMGLFMPASAALASCEKLAGSTESDGTGLINKASDSCESTKSNVLMLCDAGKKSAAPLVSKPGRNRLRIVRAVEQDASPSSAGRMVISGRMSDVCAELERMAQREQGNYKD